MASGGQYYNFYYGSNKNACSSSTGSRSSTYSGDGSGSVKGDGGRYNSRIPVAGLSSPRSRLTGGGAGHYRLSAGTGTTSWSSSGSNYSDYRNTAAGSRVSTAVEAADAYCSSPAKVTSPELGTKPGSANSSLFLTRSDSVSSSGSARSTGTVCDETAVSSCPRERQLRSTEPPSRAVTPPDPVAAAASPPPSHWLDGRGAAITSPPNRGEVVASPRSWIHQTETTAVHQDNNSAAASPPSQRKNSEKYDVTDESHEPSRPGAGGVMLRRGPTSPLRRGRPASGTPAAAAGGVAEAEEDTQSVSTVSGSGIDFFRKFVQRKGGGSGGGGCKECEDQFRREVLIDRLVADSKAVLAAVGSSSSVRSSCAAPSSSGL
jgi:hypothetical protein